MPLDHLVLADLDDTVFSTTRKQSNLADCTHVALSAKGTRGSWQNPIQRELWRWLKGFGEVVPVTARNRAALSRVELPLSRHAVWNHGASLAINGVLDAQWHALIQADLDSLAEEQVWAQVQSRLEAWIEMNPNLAETVLRGKPHIEFQDRQFQLEIKLPGIGQHIQAITEVIAPVAAGRLWVYPHYDVVALLPRRARKELAVARLLETLKPSMTVGAGDSPTDLSFMRLCDVCVAPSQSLLIKMATTSLANNLTLPLSHDEVVA